MASFLEHGEVESTCSDPTTRQAAVKISAPWCVVQAAMAVFLGHGFVDSLHVRQPMTAWMPPLSRGRFQEKALLEVPNLPNRVARVMQDRVRDLLQLFIDLSSVLKNPDDAVFLLPMSVYVTFQFRCTYENLAEVVGKLEPFGNPGVGEMRFALAAVLAELLSSVGDVETLELDAQDVPPLLRSPLIRDAAGLASSTTSTQGEDFLGKGG